MANATNYALQNARQSVGLVAAVRDIATGFMVTARFVITTVGATTLIALAMVLSLDQTRERVAELASTAFAQIALPVTATAVAAEAAADAGGQTASMKAEDPQQRAVTQYLSRRYRVADEAVSMVVAAAYDAAREYEIDPLLILSVMAIESGFNPFAESPVGAQGLMQVHTRVHTDKFEMHGGEHKALDPIANIRVGSAILKDLIRRGGSVERGLQLYVGAGNLPDDGGYGARVLAERSRLALAANGKVDAALAAGLRADATRAEARAAAAAAAVRTSAPVPAAANPKVDSPRVENERASDSAA